jgi:hypothetical protein
MGLMSASNLLFSLVLMHIGGIRVVLLVVAEA